MKTPVIHVDPFNPDPTSIQIAANIIRSGGTVGFPTETVYGLGANALDPSAVNKIFSAKGRPADNPLIVHVSSIDMVMGIAHDLPEVLYSLISRFWPGPLTLIVKKKRIVPDVVTGFQATVGIRMPKNAVALELIKKAGCPIAAPSANLSGKPSPTTAKHVQSDLDGRLDLILDGGSCEIGIEFTVLDLTSAIPIIYRPGKITPDELRVLLPNVMLYHPTSELKNPKSPGLSYRHYTPSANVVLVNGATVEDKFAKISHYLLSRNISNRRNCMLSTSSNVRKFKSLLEIDVLDIGDVNDMQSIASSLFDILRSCDDLKYDNVFCETLSLQGIGIAVMERLSRAASEVLE
jgi:L-threonylcarbamoyladenylate synthase